MAIPESGIVATREMVSARVKLDYAPSDQHAVGDLLARISYEEPALIHRVQLAVLRLASGDIARLHSCVVDARLDYRDVLVGAEYPRSGAVAGNRPGFRVSAAELAELQRQEREEYLSWLRTASPDAA